MAAKKRLTMFDAMDGALSRIDGLKEAAEKARTLPFRPKTEPDRHPVQEPTPPREPSGKPTPALGNGFDNALGNAPESSTTPWATASTTPWASTTPSTSTSTSTTPWATPWATASTTPSTTPTDKAAFLTGRKAQVLACLLAASTDGGPVVVSYPSLVASTGIPYKTLRWAMTSLERDGFFSRKDFRNGVFQGVEVTFDTALCRRFCQRQEASTTPWATPSTTPWATPSTTASTTPWASTTPSTTPSTYLIDRKNLSISLTRFEATWPNLAATGFGPAQLEQIAAALAELGKATNLVLQGLDHAEWELEHGTMHDKNGQPVDNPCAWIFRSLSRTGYYRRPAGYVSPEEQALRDAEAEAKSLADARLRSENARFEAWKAGLSDEQRAKALEGCPGGPRDAWLKAVWKRTTG